MKWLARGSLWVLVAWLLWAATTIERSSWPTLVGDEATYLMAAESLAWDGDLLYERRDYDRFLSHWKVQPEGLVLQSGDGGRHITFGKPFFYPLTMAACVRLWPSRGPFVANALLLALMAWLATRSLERRLGHSAGLWLGACLFASVAFAYTFWAHADLFLLAMSAMALSLVLHRGPRATSGGHTLWRWGTAGALLAIVVFSRPLYLPLLLATLAAVPPRRDARRAAAAFLLGAAIVAAAAGAVHRANSGAWTSYGAQRRGFYASTGFPAVDFPPEQWDSSVQDLGDAAWAEARSLLSPPPTDRSLWAWNCLYYGIGRHVGVLPYFLPLVLGFRGRPRDRVDWALLIAVALSVAGFFLYRPFNFYGGGGAIANRYFMPLYPAFWFLGRRPAGALPALLISLLAAPFLWPLWTAPRAFPLRPNHTYRYVSRVAESLLPYETTQSHLKPGGRSDVLHRGLWVKFLTPTLRARGDGRVLLLDRGLRAQLLVGSPRPLQRLELWIPTADADQVRVRGAPVAARRPAEDGQVSILEPLPLRARHPMWWTWDPVYLYQLTLESEATHGEGRIPFTLKMLREPAQGAPV